MSQRASTKGIPQKKKTKIKGKRERVEDSGRQENNLKSKNHCYLKKEKGTQ